MNNARAESLQKDIRFFDQTVKIWDASRGYEVESPFDTNKSGKDIDEEKEAR